MLVTDNLSVNYDVQKNRLYGLSLEALTKTGEERMLSRIFAQIDSGRVTYGFLNGDEALTIMLTEQHGESGLFRVAASLNLPLLDCTPASVDHFFSRDVFVYHHIDRDTAKLAFASTYVWHQSSART